MGFPMSPWPWSAARWQSRFLREAIGLLTHGQKPKQKPLPNKPKDVPQENVVHPIELAQWKSFTEAALVDQIAVAATLTDPHRLTLKLQKSLTRSAPDSYGRVNSSRDDIDIHIGPDSVPRVLRIVDAFVKAAEGRGFTFAPPKRESDRGLSLVIDRQEVQFSLLEGSNRVGPAPPKDNSRFSSSYVPQEYSPSGRMVFKIREYVGELREPSFSDRAKTPLENQLGMIMQAMVNAAHELRERAEKRAREETLAQERAEERRKAEIQHKKFDEDLENWSKAETLRRFLAQVELAMSGDPSKDDGFPQRWLEWVRDLATRLDPLSGGIDEFFDHYLQFGWDKMSRKR
jgi:hypothetical protein